MNKQSSLVRYTPLLVFQPALQFAISRETIPDIAMYLENRRTGNGVLGISLNKDLDNKRVNLQLWQTYLEKYWQLSS